MQYAIKDFRQQFSGAMVLAFAPLLTHFSKEK